MTKKQDKYPERVEKLLKKSLKSIHQGNQFLKHSACALWGASVVQGDEIHLHTNTACHAGLNYPTKDIPLTDENKIDYIFDFIVNYRGSRDANSRDVHIAFADFIMNRSWLQKAYISKDATRVWEDFCYVMDPNVNRNYLTQAMVMNRCHAENDKVLRSWYAMVENGIEENVALMLAHTWKVGNSKDTWIASLTVGHSALSGRHCMDNKISTLSYLSTNRWGSKPYSEILRYEKITAACGVDRDGFDSDVGELIAGEDSKGTQLRWSNSPLMVYLAMYSSNQGFQDVSLADLKYIEQYMLAKANLNWKL